MKLKMMIMAMKTSRIVVHKTIMIMITKNRIKSKINEDEIKWGGWKEVNDEGDEEAGEE